MDVPGPVRRTHLRWIHMIKPVVSDHLTGRIEDQTAQGVALVGIGVNSPIGPVKIFVDRSGHVHQGAMVFPQLRMLFPVDDISACGLQVIGGDQNLFDNILDAFNVRAIIRTVVMTQHLDHLCGKQMGLRITELSGGLASSLDSGKDLMGVKIRYQTGPFYNFSRRIDSLEQTNGYHRISSQASAGVVIDPFRYFLLCQ